MVSFIGGETDGPGQNNQLAASHWFSDDRHWLYIGSCKINYHTIRSQDHDIKPKQTFYITRHPSQDYTDNEKYTREQN